MTRELLEEILDVLGRPELARFIDDEAAARLIRILATAGLTETRVSARRPRDPKDAHVIEAAVAGGADAIVTGDGGLLGDEEPRAWLGERGIEVLTPAELAARLPD